MLLFLLLLPSSPLSPLLLLMLLLAHPVFFIVCTLAILCRLVLVKFYKRTLNKTNNNSIIKIEIQYFSATTQASVAFTVIRSSSRQVTVR